ncbi:class I SAM-dependent methyltransferase [Flindersiella endophytica]
MTAPNLAATANFDSAQQRELREQQIAVLGSWRQIGQVIYALSELGIADHLLEGPKSPKVLAAVTETDPDALRRALRCAAAVGIFTEDESGCFSLTPLSEGLLSEKVGGLRPMVLFSSLELTRAAYAEILYSLRTGKPAFDHVFGMPFYDYLAAHPEDGRFFESFMRHWSRRLADRFAGQIAPERFTRIADIGGGTGYFLSQLLRRSPTSSGVLFELSSVVAGAEEELRENGVDDRVQLVAGDFFTDELPADCDAYVLKSILHNWADEPCEAILRRVRAAMRNSYSRLVVLDQVVPPLNHWDHSKVIDMDMLVLFGGKERTLAEWRQLFDRTGFELANQPETGWAVLEAKPV